MLAVRATFYKFPMSRDPSNTHANRPRKHNTSSKSNIMASACPTIDGQVNCAILEACKDDSSTTSKHTTSRRRPQHMPL